MLGGYGENKLWIAGAIMDFPKQWKQRNLLTPNLAWGHNKIILLRIPLKMEEMQKRWT
jgi:hypothetical protein